jgi:hypothetical protein
MQQVPMQLQRDPKVKNEALKRQAALPPHMEIRLSRRCMGLIWVNSLDKH